MADPPQWSASDTQSHFNKKAAEYERATGGATRVTAQYLASLISLLPSDARILDNATGTGVVVEELINSVKDENARKTMSFTAVDVAPGMMNVLKAKAHSGGGAWNIREDQLYAEALAAENLDFLPWNYFDYSFTVFGFQSFKDPEKAAGHIYRTLKPGGTAYITAWADMGYIKAMDMAAEAMGKEKLKLPFGDEWSTQQHPVKLFKAAGFADVQVHQKDSIYTAKSRNDLAGRLTGWLSAPQLKTQGWSEKEIEDFPYEMAFALGTYGKDELEVDADEVRLKMVANIVVCKK